MNRALSSLKSHEAFRAVYRKGRVISEGALTLHIVKNRTNDVRFGVSISRKNGNSVVRHRFVRIIREIMRTYAPQFPCGADLVIATRKGTHYDRRSDLTLAGVQADCVKLFERAHLLTGHNT